MGKLHKVAGKSLIAGLILVKVLMIAGCGGSSSSSGSNQTAAPTFSPGGGTYTASQPVTISDATANAVLYCTTDGTTPTTSSPQCSQPTTVFKSGIVQAIAVAPGKSASTVASAAYIINLNAVATPSFSPAGGAYTSAQSVTITDATSGATIYYTTDGSTPTTASTLYTGPVAVSQSEALSAIAVASGLTNSGVAVAAYVINPVIATPTFSVPTGNYTAIQTVTISDATAGAQIYYTLDGSVPTAKSTLYTAAISVSKTEVLSAVAIVSGNSSPVATAAYAITLPQPVPAPTFNPASGATVTSGQSVTIADGDANASIYYTTDGTAPTASSTKYTAPVVLSTAGAATIEAIAIDSGNSSPVGTATYTVNAAGPPAPTFNPASGTAVTAGQSVTIADGDAKASIYYTTDGTTPTAGSTQYTAPVVLSKTGTSTIEAIAIDAGVSSSVGTATYTVSSAGVALTGTVSSGTLPVNGAQVQLYAAGQTGYGSAATAVGSAVTTSSSGAFSLNYNCPSAPGDQMYVVATGGDAGKGANTGIALMAALGSCSNLPAAVTVNEVTTVASAYALSPFAAVNTSGGGITVGAPAGGTSCNAAGKWQSTGAETCNYTGLSNAFLAVSNLVNVTGAADATGTAAGAARTHTPAYPSDLSGDPNILDNSTVPTTRINALADMLASCVESDGTGCSGGLFSAASTSGTPPADTLQAVLNIALNPGNNVDTLLGLVGSMASPPYSTTGDSGSLVLSGTGAPTDLTLAVTFTGAGLGGSSTTFYPDGNVGSFSEALGIDAAGNIWVGSNLFSENFFTTDELLIAEFNALGAPVTPSTTLNSGTPTYGGYDPDPSEDGNTNNKIGSLVVDQSGNLWTSDNGNDVFQINTLPGLSTNTIPAIGRGGLLSFVVDFGGNAWLVQGGVQVDEILKNGSAGVTGQANTNYTLEYLTFDSNGGLWNVASGANSNGDVFQLSTSDGSVVYDAFPSSTGTYITTLVADNAGNIYGCDPTGLNLDVFNTGATTAPSNLLVNSYPITTQRGCGTQLVLDGQGHLFSVLVTPLPIPGLGNFTANIDEFTTAGTLVSPQANGYTGSSSMEAATLNPDAFLESKVTGVGAAIDGSGNLWVLNVETFGGVNPLANSLVEYIGIGAPVATPASAALTNGVLGTRP